VYPVNVEMLLGGAVAVKAVRKGGRVGRALGDGERMRRWRGWSIGGGEGLEGGIVGCEGGRCRRGGGVYVVMVVEG
jgi:hypothetical protein